MTAILLLIMTAACAGETTSNGGVVTRNLTLTGFTLTADNMLTADFETEAGATIFIDPITDERVVYWGCVPDGQCPPEEPPSCETEAEEATSEAD